MSKSTTTRSRQKPAARKKREHPLIDPVNQRIRQLREYADKNQTDFGTMMNCTQSQISVLEKGGNAVSGAMIQALRKNFPNLNFNWLFYGIGPIVLHNAEALLVENAGIQYDLASLDTSCQVANNVQDIERELTRDEQREATIAVLFHENNALRKEIEESNNHTVLLAVDID